MSPQLISHASSAEVEQAHRHLLEFFQLADRTGAVTLLERWAQSYGFAFAFEKVLQPALEHVGASVAVDAGTSSEVTLAQAYVASKVTEDLLEKGMRTLGSDQTPASRGPVVIANVEDDFHALGKRMVATLLRAQGWDVHDLGVDVPSDEVVDKAVALGARVIGVSAMTMSTAANIRGIRKELDDRGLSGKIQLAVGGAVFVVVGELWREVGGDATARSMFEAPQVFTELWQRAVAEGSMP